MFPIQCNCEHEIPYYYSFFGIYYICVVYIYIYESQKHTNDALCFPTTLTAAIQCLSRTTLRLQGDLGPYPLQPIPQPDWKKPSTRCKSVWCGHHAVRV